MSDEKRCVQCNKIIVGDSKLGLCPKCADKDARGVAEGILVLSVMGFIAKKVWKPAKQAIKGAVKIITKS